MAKATEIRHKFTVSFLIEPKHCEFGNDEVPKLVGEHMHSTHTCTQIRGRNNFSRISVEQCGVRRKARNTPQNQPLTTHAELCCFVRYIPTISFISLHPKTRIELLCRILWLLVLQRAHTHAPHAQQQQRAKKPTFGFVLFLFHFTFVCSLVRRIIFISYFVPSENPSN